MKKIKKWVVQHLWLISFLLILFVGGTTLSVFAQKMNKELPDNPLKKDQVASRVLLAGEDQEIANQLNEKGIELGDKKSREAVDKEGQEDNQAKDEASLAKEKEPTNKPQDVDEQSRKQPDMPKDQPKDSTKKEVVKDNQTDDKKEKQDYFHTTIKDGETVSKADYKFDIIQKNHEVKVVKQQVLLNFEPVEFTGIVMLKPGENTITIQVTYKDKENKEFMVEKQYTLNYSVVVSIETDLENNEHLTTEKKTFEAYALVNDKKEALDVFQDGKLVEPKSEFIYEVSLLEGENIFELKADQGEAPISEKRTLIYQKSSEEKPKPDLEEPSGENQDPDAPIIDVMGLKKGHEYGKMVTFEVSVKDSKGNYIHQGDTQPGYTVEVNGEIILPVWEDNHGKHKGSYKAQLVKGQNTILIKAIDQSGKTNALSMSVTSRGGEAGEENGTVTISVQASTVGRGYIIPPTEIPNKEDTPASQLLIEWLEKSGYSYASTGRPDSSFYLGKIIANNGDIWDGKSPRIPDDLMTFLEDEQGMDVDMERYEQDGLGEFDFTSGSGWMYSVNNVYPSVGFSDYYLNDGDEVRLRYTLSLGSDIGGSINGGSGNHEW